MELRVKTSPKMLRERLCSIQQRIGALDANKEPYKETWVAQLQELIDEVDRHRPLGPDGKHGDRHTTTCGCKDEWKARWRDPRYVRKL